MKRRLFLLVLDSFGIGYAPDACEFGDEGANTLKSIMRSPCFNAPNLKELGLFNIDGVGGGISCPTAAYGRLRERSRGKDTTIGHWEIAGLVSDSPMPTYPDGFPGDVVKELETAFGRKILCNKAYSGTEVIRDYGDEHLKTGALIVYTSADSVLQIAAHESIVSNEELYEYCRRARKISDVGRVIARPFETVDGEYKRTANRRDFSLEPHGRTLLDAMSENGYDVISVGKIYDIFASRGITDYFLTHSNAEGMQKSLELTKRDFNGLCFINLVDFDSAYGHRNDIDGYAKAISEFDSFLPGFLNALGDDVFIITADHGCDPGDISTDHTREYTPLIVYGKNINNINLGTMDGFNNIAKTAADMFGIDFETDADGFYERITR